MFHMFSRVFGNSFSWLGEYSRPLLVSGSNVTILSTPGEYLQWLKVCRIFKIFILFLFYRARLILLSWGSVSPLFILVLESSRRNWYVFLLCDSIPFIPRSLSLRSSLLVLPCGPSPPSSAALYWIVSAVTVATPTLLASSGRWFGTSLVGFPSTCTTPPR